jgi:hypothetical protein
VTEEEWKGGWRMVKKYGKKEEGCKYMKENKISYFPYYL